MKKLHPKTNITLTGSRSGLTAYLAGAAGFTAALAAPQADAAVTAVTFGFGPTFTAADSVYDDFWSVGGFGMLAGFSDGISVYLGANPTGNRGSVYQTDSYLATQGLAKFFPNGTVIGNSLNGALGAAFWNATYVPSIDFTSDQLNKNIGFKTNTNNWGYANVSWTEATKVLAINSAFVESVPNTPITIVPEPGVASLLVLGAVAAARGRRRQKTAA